MRVAPSGMALKTSAMPPTLTRCSSRYFPKDAMRPTVADAIPVAASGLSMCRFLYISQLPATCCGIVGETYDFYDTDPRWHRDASVHRITQICLVAPCYHPR